MIPIIYEDQHIIIVNKPVGMPSQKDRSRDLDVLTAVEKYLNTKGDVALISRLDRPVGGLMLLTKHKEATQVFSTMQQNKTDIHKYYLVLVDGRGYKKSALLTDYMMKTHEGVSMVWKGEQAMCPHDKRYKIAQLEYNRIKEYTTEDQGYTLLSVQLKTGRFHQIRAQLSAHGMPIYGDTKYNSRFSGLKGWHQIALCSYKLDFEHPLLGKKLYFEISPDYFPMNLEE